MAQSIQPGRFGHSGKPDDAWLEKQEKEPILEPELPIIDTHHHLCGPLPQTGVIGFKSTGSATRKPRRRIALHRTCRFRLQSRGSLLRQTPLAEREDSNTRSRKGTTFFRQESFSAVVGGCEIPEDCADMNKKRQSRPCTSLRIAA
jgi:hypothetical protein